MELNVWPTSWREKGFTLVEILLALGIMSGVGLLTAKLMENYRSIYSKTISDLDIQIKHLEAAALIRSQVSCSYGIQDESGKNLLYELGPNEIDVYQIIQYAQSPGGSPSPSLNTSRNLRVSPPGVFDIFGGKLRIDRMVLAQNSVGSKIGRITISYEVRSNGPRRTINRYVHFPYNGEGTARVCSRTDTEDVFCKSKQKFCESLGKSKALWVDFSPETLSCECIVCPQGMFIGVNNEMARGCVDIQDFNERKILNKNTNLGIIAHRPHQGSAYGYDFQGCPAQNEAFSSFNPTTKSFQCSPIIRDDQQMNCDPIITQDAEGVEQREEQIPWFQYVDNQLRVYCVKPENFSPGLGCPDQKTLCVGQSEVTDSYGIPCRGSIVPENSYFYLDTSDTSCAARDDNLIKPALGKFKITEIKCMPGNQCGQNYDCSESSSSVKRYYLPCD